MRVLAHALTSAGRGGPPTLSCTHTHDRGRTKGTGCAQPSALGAARHALRFGRACHAATQRCCDPTLQGRTASTKSSPSSRRHRSAPPSARHIPSGRYAEPYPVPPNRVHTARHCSGIVRVINGLPSYLAALGRAARNDHRRTKATAHACVLSEGRRGLGERELARMPSLEGEASDPREGDVLSCGVRWRQPRAPH